MSFKSYAQQAYMFKFHPEIAARWEDKYGALKKPANYKPGKHIEAYKRLKKHRG
jgi:hypothetical protein